MLGTNQDRNTSIGLLILRVGVAALLFFPHGWPKLANFAASSQTFADPIGLGSTTSLSLVVFAEVVCAVLVGFGFLTRLACVPIIIFMLVAVFLQLAADPFSKKELAIVYGIASVALFCAGPGRYSFDGLIGGLWRSKGA